METTKSQKKKVGRPAGTPDKLNPEVQEAICVDLAKSIPDKYAAEANGISERTFREWVELGAKGQEPYAAFFAAVTRARAIAVRLLTDTALEGEKGCSQATWFLERRYRKEYGPIQKLELGGDPDGVPLKIENELDKLTADDLRRIASD